MAVVTGGSRGIGAAAARLLASRGWTVAISYRSDHYAATAVVAACEAAGGSGFAVQADVASEEALRGGPGSAPSELSSTTLASSLPRAASTNCRPPASSTCSQSTCWGRSCAPERPSGACRPGTEDPGGAIVNVSSAAARLGSGGEYVDYAASKGAIDTMTVGLATEVAGEGIRVNAVRPGLIRTEIHASGGQPDRVERLRSVIPMRRGGEPDEIGAAVAWLCSREASYVTGAILDVAGGR